jgi:cytochrome b subunit of formate dehydrogenase
VQFTGATVRWFFYRILNRFQGHPVSGFAEIRYGKSNLNKQGKFENGMKNVFWGYMAIFSLVTIGFLIDRLFY